MMIVGPFNVGVFLYITAFFKNYDKKEALQNLKAKYLKTLTFAACFSPLVYFIAYNYFPFHLRYLCFDFFGFIYSVILSLINNHSAIITNTKL